MSAFIFGFMVASACWFLAVLWVAFRRNSPVVLVDPYWLGNEDRWASLRDIVLAEFRPPTSLEEGDSR